ncbi:MAG: hypothetical protein ACTSYD_02545 [Candidatus Heimdallarchaeaceae archaeon]
MKESEEALVGRVIGLMFKLEKLHLTLSECFSWKEDKPSWKELVKLCKKIDKIIKKEYEKVVE